MKDLRKVQRTAFDDPCAYADQCTQRKYKTYEERGVWLISKILTVNK